MAPSTARPPSPKRLSRASTLSPSDRALLEAKTARRRDEELHAAVALLDVEVARERMEELRVRQAGLQARNPPEELTARELAELKALARHLVWKLSPHLGSPTAAAAAAAKQFPRVPQLPTKKTIEEKNLLREQLGAELTGAANLFRILDSDGSGTINRLEFREVVGMLGFNVSEQACDLLFNEQDIDGSGEIQYQEWVRYALRDAVVRSRNTIKRLFRQWDIDASGTINQREFRRALATVGLDAPEDQMDKVFEELDTDHSGEIDVLELNKLLKLRAKEAEKAHGDDKLDAMRQDAPAASRAGAGSPFLKAHGIQSHLDGFARPASRGGFVRSLHSPLRSPRVSELSTSPASCGPLTPSRAIEAGAAFTAASPTALGGQPAAAAAIDEAAAAAFVAAEEEEMREMELDGAAHRRPPVGWEGTSAELCARWLRELGDDCAEVRRSARRGLRTLRRGEVLALGLDACAFTCEVHAALTKLDRDEAAFGREWVVARSLPAVASEHPVLDHQSIAIDLRRSTELSRDALATLAGAPPLHPEVLVKVDRTFYRPADCTPAVRKAALASLAELGKRHPAALAHIAEAISWRCGHDTSAEVRHAAVRTLATLTPALLAPHAAVLIGRCDEDDDVAVRLAATEALGMLEPTALASLGGTALAARCEDIDRLVRRAALESLAHLEPLQLCAHDDALVGRLRDVDWAVREAALRVLSQLPPQELGAHADALAERLDDSEWLVRRQAVMALSRTPPEQLARHLASLLVRLEDSYRDELGVMPVRVAVVKVLGKLPPALLNSGAASSLVRRLKDIDPTVRRAALDALAHLSPRALATHGPTVNAMLADCHAGVRVGAARFLARLPPATLERHTDALLLAATTDDAQPVRRAALEALNVLDLRLVEQYAARRSAECVARFRFLAALDPVEPPSTTIGRQRAYLAKKGAEVLVVTKTEAAPAAAPDGGTGMFGGIFGFLSGGQVAPVAKREQKQPHHV